MKKFLSIIFYLVSSLFNKFTINKKNKIDTIFVILFGTLLFIPMIKISHAEKSEQENRMLAKYQPLFIDGRLNKKFGTQFDNYFNDRFNGRNFLTRIFSNLSYFLNNIYQTNEAIFFKKQNIMFNKSNIRSYTYTNHILEKSLNGVFYYKDFCNKNKIKCYIEVVPEKLLFENNEIFNGYKNRIGKFDKITQYIKEKSDFNIIYPLNILKEANQKERIYFRTDHHWNDWGTYNGYLALMNEIKKDFPLLNILSLDNFKKTISNKVRAEYNRGFGKGSICNRLNLSENNCNLSENYNYYDFEDKGLELIKTDDNTGKNFKYLKAKNNQKVMIIGNSFVENFVTFLAPSFKEVRKKRCNTSLINNLNLSRWEKEILEYKPDVLIILVEENYARGKLKTLKDS